MEKTHIAIKPGIGLGDIKLGMSREEIESILGKPEFQEITSFEDEGETFQSDSWEYHGLRMDLTFEEAEKWRLVIISVSSDDYLLLDKKLIGSDMEELMNELSELNINDIEVEDLSTDDNPDFMLVSSEEHAINFWLPDNVVEEIQIAPRINEDNTIAWPE
ncbi:MAG: hypothetical protein AB8B73_10190 [Ekhidna sp.]